MPLGDSITAGNGDWTSDGYRAELGRHLQSAGLAYDFVGSMRAGTSRDRDHEGHGGWTIDRVRSRIDGWLDTHRPDIVLLDLGTNDMRKDIDPAGAPVRLSALIDTILATQPHTQVLVAKLILTPSTPQPGWSPRLPEMASRMAAFNAALPTVVAAKGSRVTLVDMSRVPWANTKDGIHPTPLGYRQMAYQWYQRLRGTVPGGDRWPAIANPFPLPAAGLVTLVRSSDVKLTARLSGRLALTELTGVRVQFRHRPVGGGSWRVLGQAITGSDGTVTMTHRDSPEGDYQVRIADGRAAGQLSKLVRVGAPAKA